MRHRVIRIQLDGALEFLFGAREIPFEIRLDHCKRGVSFRDRIVERKGFLDRFASLACALSDGRQALFAEQDVAVSYPRISLGEVRILVDRLPEVVEGLAEPFFASLIPMVTALEVSLISFAACSVMFRQQLSLVAR